MHICRAIRSIRQELSISQRKLGLECNISQTSLSQIENEIKWPTQKTIDKICQALEIPEILLYIVALQEEEVPASKRQKYHIIFPSIINLTLQLVSTEHASLVNNINVVEKERQIFKNLREPA